MVKKLTLHAQQMPLYKSREDWQKCINMRPSFYTVVDMCLDHFGFDSFDDLRPYVPEGEAPLQYMVKKWEELPRIQDGVDLEASWQLYKSFRKDQQKFVAHGKMLESALERLDGLGAVEISQLWMPRPQNEDPFWRKMIPQLLQGPDEWRTLPTDLYGTPTEAVQLDQLLYGLSRSPSRCKSLNFQTPGADFWNRLGVMDPSLLVEPSLLGGHILDANLYGVNGAFKHLTHLDATVRIISDDTNWHLVAGGLKGFLQEASCLEWLNLEYLGRRHWDREADLAYDSLKDPFHILSEHHWPALRTFNIECDTRAYNLVQFLKRHSATLRHLSFKRVSFSPGQGLWEPVIHKLPQWLKLESINLEWCFDDTCRIDGFPLLSLFSGAQDSAYMDAIRHYCIHGGQRPVVDSSAWNRSHPDQRVTDDLFFLMGPAARERALDLSDEADD